MFFLSYCSRVQEGLNTFSNDGSEAVAAAEHQRFTMDQQQPLNSFTISSTSYDYPSSLLETLYNSSSPPLPPSQQPPYNLESNSNDFNFVQSLPSMRLEEQVSANNTPFWNASTSTLDDKISSFSSSSSSQFLPSSYVEKVIKIAHLITYIYCAKDRTRS